MNQGHGNFDEGATAMASTGHAKWTGGFEDGQGTADTGSGAVSGLTYTAASRFSDGAGSNPEELIGAAHAACFSMALTLGLEQAGHSPESVETTATVTMKKEDAGFAIHRIELATVGTVPGISDEEFQEQAEAAKEGCPVSRALASVPEIVLDAKLAG
jgi:osmotically inducible protein OsmC